ncbi:uncharacterized protein LOC134213326 [Armigeres subalbatus]|uniref:uncharacterized protein LOC134213326 n=1 Tax=Armigeres subalbatus TaxID=124917 RepID=UPI002ED2E07D
MESKLGKIVSIAIPIFMHALGISVVNVFADKGKMSESMLPDVASLMFVTATSMIVTAWLEKNAPRLLGGNGAEEDSLLVLVIGVLSNLAFCDLSLRVIWIPVQYFLRYLKDQQILVYIIRWMFFYFRYIRFTRNILVTWIKASKTDAGFLLMRNLVASLYLLKTLLALGIFSGIKTLRTPRKK